MTVWKSAAVATAFAAASAAAAALAPAAHAQDRDGQALRLIQSVGRNSQLGVTVHDPESGDAKPPMGVVVDEVRRGSAAEKAGIKAGDAIVEFDGERIRSARQFARLVHETAPGRTVAIVLARGGQRTTVNAEIAATTDGEFGYRLLESLGTVRIPEPPMPPLPPAMDRIRPFDFELFVGRGGRLGVTVEDLNQQLAVYFGVKDGVLVKSVDESSAAAKAGLKAGDVITAINGSHVAEPRDLTRALGRLESGGEFTLEIVRDRKSQTIKGKLEPRVNRERVRTVPDLP